jgi:hypothetical protein
MSQHNDDDCFRFVYRRSVDGLRHPLHLGRVDWPLEGNDSPNAAMEAVKRGRLAERRTPSEGCGAWALGESRPVSEPLFFRERQPANEECGFYEFIQTSMQAGRHRPPEAVGG